MEREKELLKNVELFVLDMDGTFYLGEHILQGALDFLEDVRRSGKKYIFFTNNSSRAPEDYIRKLAGMNCFIDRQQSMTSGDVTIEYIKKCYSGKTVYLLGTEALTQSFLDAGIRLTEDQPDLVVVGFDTTLNYEKLEKACTYIRQGAVFLATHLDINCPVENGFLPDCGAICKTISLSTGVKPKYLGKPYPETVQMIREKTKVKKKNMAFVGDRIYTDVATGVKNGAAGILVLTGETTKEMLKKSRIKPDAVYQSIGEIGKALEKM